MLWCQSIILPDRYLPRRKRPTEYKHAQHTQKPSRSYHHCVQGVIIIIEQARAARIHAHIAALIIIACIAVVA